MTTNPLRAARGTTASLTARVLLDGELAYNTTTEELHVGDGATLGGRPISSEVDGVPSYTVAGLPSGLAGDTAYVSNEVGGAVLAFHDGTNWRRVTDRAIVS